MVHATDGRRRAIVFALVAVTSALGLTGVAQRPASAALSAVKGYACGYYTNVGLFGGPQAKLGCAPQVGTSFAQATAATLSPSVELPPGGSATPITVTDPDGATGKYGPAVIFGGIWPEHVGSGPPSGPITVTAQGTPAGGTVTASTEIGLYSPANPDAPGGFGPMPVWGDSLRVECSASETAVSGLTTFTNSFIATATDPDGGPLPSATEPIPTTPPANYTRQGVITNVGDVFTAVFNEQIRNPDGSLTVNAVHMYLFGPTAVGDMVKGQVTCGTTPAAPSVGDTAAPTCGTPVVAPVAPDDPTPRVPRQEYLGVFDTGGLQSITNVQVNNGTVKTGIRPNNDADPANDYLTLIPGQKGPLTMVATRTDESLPMIWSFDATDTVGNTVHCAGVMTGPTTAVVQGTAEPGDTVSVSGAGVTPSVSYRLVMGTSVANCRTSSLVLGGNVVSSAQGTLGPVNRVIPTNATSGGRYLCWVRVGDTSNAAGSELVTIV